MQEVFSILIEFHWAEKENSKCHFRVLKCSLPSNHDQFCTHLFKTRENFITGRSTKFGCCIIVMCLVILHVKCQNFLKIGFRFVVSVPKENLFISVLSDNRVNDWKQQQKNLIIITNQTWCCLWVWQPRQNVLQLAVIVCQLFTTLTYFHVVCCYITSTGSTVLLYTACRAFKVCRLTNTQVGTSEYTACCLLFYFTTLLSTETRILITFVPQEKTVFSSLLSSSKYIESPA